LAKPSTSRTAAQPVTGATITTASTGATAAEGDEGRTATEATDDTADKREAGLKSYHVARRHDDGAQEYDSADAIERGGPAAANRLSTRKMRPSDAKGLLDMGVLSETKPKASQVPASSMVSDPANKAGKRAS
jgi:hypothetical protein